MEISVNEQWAEELHKPEIKQFKRRNVYVRFKDNIWAADLAALESLSSKNKNPRYLLCEISVFIKHTCVKPLKDKKGKTVLNAFIEIVNESNREPNNHGLIKEDKCIINLCKNGLVIKIY